MRKLEIKPSRAIIAITALATLGVGAETVDGTQPVADIKPALAMSDFDEEQMRLAQVIHKRVTDYQQIKNKVNNSTDKPFVAYEETLKSGAKFEMLPVGSGSFTWKGEQEGDTLEVELSAFWMGKAEVTWEEYDPYMNSELPRVKDGQLPSFMREQIKDDLDFLARPTTPYHPMTFGMPRDGHPAIGMTQHAANKYCQWISFQTGHFYRLPTEAEWEYACRAGSKTKYSWGDNEADAGKYAWLGGEAGSHYQKPAQKKPNAWGFYDMHGNVLEWTLDQYVPNRQSYFGKKKVVNPWVKATKPYPHVAKGGYWKQSLNDVLASARQQSDPVWKDDDPQGPRSIWYHTREPYPGMRVVRPSKIPTAEEMYHYWNSGVAED